MRLERALDNFAFAIIKVAARAPRGGFVAARLLSKFRKGLRKYPVPTRYGLIICDLGEPICFPLVQFGEYSWRDDEIAFARIGIISTSVVVDIGANIGVTTHLFAKQASHVHAFEPAPRALELLRANAGKNVTVHAVALSDANGTARFEQCQKLDLSHISEAGIEVPMRTLDSFGLKPTFIKIDVEGHEPRVLRGATETLKSSPIVMFEALNEDARRECEDVILAANPRYRFERVSKHNCVGWPI